LHQHPRLAAGITVMQMDAGLDSGPIVIQERLPIAPDDDAGTLHDKLALLGARLILPALDGIAAGTLTPRAQPAEGVVYASKLTPRDERLDWQRPAAELARQVRALAPRPGAWFTVNGERLKALAAELIGETFESAPGVVLDDRLTISCGRHALRITRIQRAGKAPLAAGDFLRGYRLPRGTALPLPGEGAT
jgi:methionyl-tRNA formyltransferase